MHLAQVNIGRVKGSMDDPVMHGFASRLDEINALAEASPGFIWRLQGDEGNSTSYRLYDDDRMLINMSVWETVEQLRDFTYVTAHAELLRQRREWFEKFDRVFLALWWIPEGHLPTIEEAKERLAHIDAHGPTPVAFTFKTVFPPDAVTLG
jgi:hypothetical protein